MADQAAALANVVVLNLMQGEAGATTSFYLAQLGARVILVEPWFGAPLRAQAQALPRGEALWSAWHANQESLAVGFDSAAGQDLVLALVEKVDVLVEDSPAVVEQLELSYERVAQLNPSLVYGSMRSWASEEFFNGLESEVMLQAIAGFMAQTGHPDGPPLRSGAHYVAGLSGAHLAIGVMAAIFEAKRTGTGQHVQVVQQEVGMSATPSAYQEKAEYEEKTRYAGDNKTGGTPSGLFRTKPFGPDDWCHIYVAANAADRWEGFVRAIGREDLLSDPDYATAQGRTKKTPEINALAAAWCAERTKAEVMLILGPQGIPVGAMNSTEDIMSFDHVQASGMFDPVDSSQGPVAVPGGLPLQLSGSWVPIRRGPKLGEHTEAILEWLGREDELSSLRKAQVIL